MQLFYNPNLSKDTQQIVFDKAESRHIIKVLRKQTNDVLLITNGKGLVAKTSIESASDKKCIVKVISIDSKQKSRDYYLHIAIAPTKNNDRLEWFLEKATEIGIDEITPIICENSERKVVKLERLEKMVISAMKQSLQFYAPKLNAAISFSDFLKTDFDGVKYIAHCEDGEKESLKNSAKPKQNILILIGPEGDFSQNEINKALQENYSPISLGKTRLRTETAGIVAVQNIAFINQ